MGKALKSIVVVNVLLSAVVIWFGYVSFSSRQVLKAEALELEQTVTELSQSLLWAEDVAWEQPDQKKPIPYTFSQPASAEGLPTLESELNSLSRFATQRQSQLSQRNSELNETKRTLAETRETLKQREDEIEIAKTQVDELTVDLEKAQNRVAEESKKLNDLKEIKSGQDTEVASKNEQLTGLNNELASLEIDLETRIQERNNVQESYDRCRGSAAGETQQKGNVRGKKGLVLAVNPDWQYVVIDKGDTDIKPDYSAFVHRGKEYVGKLKVIQVEDSLAIAEIIPGSVANDENIKPGDTLFF